MSTAKQKILGCAGLLRFFFSYVLAVARLGKQANVVQAEKSPLERSSAA